MLRGMKSCTTVKHVAHERVGRLTKKRLDLGCTLRKMSEKSADGPIQSTTRPTMGRTSAETGVRLPNALARRKRGILFHRPEDVLLLRVEHVRDLGHDAHLWPRLRLVRAAERERMDAE